jgi:hypothetical protein
MGAKRYVYKVLARKPEGKIWRKREYIKMDFNETLWKGVDWIYVAPEVDSCGRAVGNTAMNRCFVIFCVAFASQCL